MTGASGFLGWELATELVRRGQPVLGSSRDGTGVPPEVEPLALDLDDGGAAAAEAVRRLRPRRVLHLAGLSDVGACARDPQRAQRVNAQASGALARATADVEGWLLYASSDLVFDGTRPPYGEEAPPSPLGPYMASKAEGERAVLAASPTFLVARLALLYGRGEGPRRRCFTDTLVEALRAGRSLRLFTDEHRTPLEVRDAAAILADLGELQPAGVLHVGGPERVSRHGLGLAVARALGLDEALCLASTRDAVPGLGPRPADVSLRIERLRGLLGRTPLGVAAGCARLRP